MSEPRVKAVIDCSQTGALNPETATAFADALRQAALTAIENDDLAKAATLMQDAKDALAQGAATGPQLVELTPDETADIEAHEAEHAQLAAAAHNARLGDLTARCDRYLAQTDWIMAPAAARPTDMSKSLAKACDTHAKKWAAWRTAVKAIRDAAVAGTANPDAPGFPDQPAAPAIALT